jgi:hypothetical protein
MAGRNERVGARAAAEADDHTDAARQEQQDRELERMEHTQRLHAEAFRQGAELLAPEKVPQGGKGKKKARGRIGKGKRMNDAEKDAMDKFNPGAFPLLLGAEESEPSGRAPYFLDWNRNHQEIAQLYGLYRNSAKFQRYFESIAITTNAAALDQFHRDFLGMAALCQGQMAKLEGTSRQVRIDGYDVLNQKLPHVESIWVYASQIGSARLDKISYEAYLHSPKSEVKRAIRLAQRLTVGVVGAAEVGHRAAFSWLPVTVDEYDDIRLRCRARIEEVLEANNIAYIAVEPGLAVLTGAQPPWWNGIQANVQGQLADFFVAAPNTQAGWINWVNGLAAGAFGGSLPRTRNVVAGDFSFDLGQDEVLPLIERWVQSMTVLEETFVITFGLHVPSGSVTVLQQGNHTQGGTVWTVRSFTNDQDDYSGLAMLVPLHTRYLRDELGGRHVVYRTSSDLSVVRALWLESTLKRLV